MTAHDDARVAQVRKIGRLRKERDEAGKKLDAAKEALADARAEEGREPGGACVPEPGLTAAVSGLPDRVAGGTTAYFTLRVTNGTGETMDQVYPYAAVHAFDAQGLKELDSHLDVEWSTAANPAWRDIDLLDGYSVGSLAAKASADVRLRLKADADVPAGQGAVLVAADYVNADESCGGHPDLNRFEFRIQAGSSGAGDAGKAGNAEGRPAGTTAQGGASTTPVNGSGGTGTGSGSLAATGSNGALPAVALAGGAALVLGAGAMAAARRRRAGAGA